MSENDRVRITEAVDGPPAQTPSPFRRFVRFIVVSVLLAAALVFALVALPALLSPGTPPGEQVHSGSTEQEPRTASGSPHATPNRLFDLKPMPDADLEPVVPSPSESTEGAPTFFGIPAVAGSHGQTSASPTPKPTTLPAPKPPAPSPQVRTPPKEEDPPTMAARLNKEGWRLLTKAGTSHRQFGRIVAEGGGAGDQKLIGVVFIDGTQQTLRAAEWSVRNVAVGEAVSLQETILQQEAKKP